MAGMADPAILYARFLRPSQAGWWALPLRASIGFGFLFHGYAKLSHGPDKFGHILAGLHMPVPDLLAWLTTVTELTGGLAILTGTLVPLAALPMAFVLLVAIVTVHLPNGFDGIKLMGFAPDGTLKFGKPGFETDLAYLAGLAALALGGDSPLSFDRLLRRRVDSAHHQH
jgi:putative oxidoreductase